MTQANNVATQCNKITALGVLKATGGGTNATSPGASGNVLTSTGTDWASLPVSGFLRSTRYFTTPGIFTYTPNSGVSYIIVTCIGGGGGGASSGSVPGYVTIGGDGGASYFGSFMTANGGHGGLTSDDSYYFYDKAGLGGTATGGDLNISGGDANSMISYPTGGYTYFYAGNGGSSPFGGAGQGCRDGNGVGQPGVANTGGGGGGGGWGGPNNYPRHRGGSGGGAGGYCVKKITSGFSSVSYQVGGGGAGGASVGSPPAPYFQAFAGVNGGSGIIIVQEFS